MIAPRWKKTLADLWVSPARSLLAVLAMAVSIGALSTLAFQRSILSPVLSGMHAETEPASATLYVDTVDDALVAIAKEVPGVGEAEGRPIVMARTRVGEPGAEEWISTILYVIRDFDEQRINLFTPNDGAWSPGSGQVLLERSAVEVADAVRGDDLQLRIAGGDDCTLSFVGTVHAPGLAPGWMENTIYGFVPWTSIARGDTHRESSQLLILVKEHQLELGHINEVAGSVKAEIESRGYAVSRVDVPAPGRHPHADQMETFLYLLAAFGILAFFLSVVLVASMIHTLQSEQVKQIGMMKSIGATSSQIASVYLVHVCLLAVAALGIGVPLGWISGKAYAGFSAGILNADVSRASFPWLTLLGILVVGLVVPLLAALIPVWRASQITVHEALTYTSGTDAFGGKRFDRWLAKISWLPRPMALVLRATLFRRVRLALTVCMLAIGGAIFMAAINVSKGWEGAADDTFTRRHYQLVARFTAEQPVSELDAAFATVPGIVRAEYWPVSEAFLIGPSGAAGKQIAFLGIDPASELMDLKLSSGKWLDPGEGTGVVINQAVLYLNPSLGVGGKVSAWKDGRTITFPIIGIVKELQPQPVIYTPVEALLDATGETGDMARTARIVVRERGEAPELEVARDLETMFRRLDIELDAVHRVETMKQSILDHLVIIQVILLFAAAIVVLVGGIGLTSTLTINVFQRTREIGVMSAIGASPRTLATHVWCEGVLIGLLSWIVAIAFAAPVTYVLEVVTGRMFFKAPLDFTMSPIPTVIWLGLVLVIASVSSFHPARRASRLTVREAINYV